MRRFNKELYIKFYDSCVPVIGANSGVIYDIQRGEIHFFPKILIEKLLETTKKNIKLKSIYNVFTETTPVLEEYIDYLINIELIFLTEYPENFVGLNTEFLQPFLLDVILLEIDILSEEKIKLIQRPDLYGCKELILITREEFQEHLFLDILKYLKGNKIQNIKLITKYSPSIKIENYLKIEPRLREILFYESPYFRKKESATYINNSLEAIMNRRIENIQDFAVNLHAFTESLNHNLFFNRKIYVNNNDKIKHYFSEKNGFEKLKENNLISIINKDSFKELWDISKDQIEICKDCEFRYICPDNRIPIKRKNRNIYFHKTKCNYNPYTTKWKT